MMEPLMIKTWILYFFTYSFLGWIWESCYVSVLQKTWTNRGFVKGPCLPLYGSGAVLLLLISEPFAENTITLYFVGVIGATALEYVTGVLMEMLFKVRYWDYSDQKFNLKGYICLSSSVTWGFFAIAITDYIHPVVARLLSYIPVEVLNIVLPVILVVFSCDFTLAFKHALQFRILLEKLAAARAELSELTDRLETAMKGNLDSVKATVTDNFGSLKNVVTGIRHLSAMFNVIEQFASDLKNMREDWSVAISEHLLLWRDRLGHTIGSLTSRQRQILKNHSHAVSKKYAEELELLKDLLNGKNDKKST